MSRWPTASRTTSAPASRTTSFASRSASTARAEGCAAGAQKPARIAVAFALAAALAAASCSTPTDTQPFPGACEPLRVLEWTPHEGALDVPPDQPLTIRLDDTPDPDTVGTSGFIVTTGVYYHLGIYATDLIDKTVSVRFAGGLRSNLGYDVTVHPTLTSLRGCPAVEATHSFRTAAAGSMKPQPPLEPVPFSAVRPIFARSCAGAACHRAEEPDPGAGCLERPAAALSLCDRDAVRALVDVPSRQVSRLSLVAPHDSSRSYLLRKLLPGDTPDRPAPPTPGHRDPPGAPLSRDELRAIANWIDAGARP